MKIPRNHVYDALLANELINSRAPAAHMPISSAADAGDMMVQGRMVATPDIPIPDTNQMFLRAIGRANQRMQRIDPSYRASPQQMTDWAEKLQTANGAAAAALLGCGCGFGNGPALQAAAGLKSLKNASLTVLAGVEQGLVGKNGAPLVPEGLLAEIGPDQLEDLVVKYESGTLDAPKPADSGPKAKKPGGSRTSGPDAATKALGLKGRLDYEKRMTSILRDGLLPSASQKVRSAHSDDDKVNARVHVQATRAEFGEDFEGIYDSLGNESMGLPVVLEGGGNWKAAAVFVGTDSSNIVRATPDACCSEGMTDEFRGIPANQIQFVIVPHGYGASAEKAAKAAKKPVEIIEVDATANPLDAWRGAVAEAIGEASQEALGNPVNGLESAVNAKKLVWSHIARLQPSG